MRRARRSTRPGGAVLALERDRGARAGVGHQPGDGEDRAHGVAIDVDVLGRERVDRRVDHDQAIAVEALPRERLAREHVDVGVEHIRPQERPRLAGEIVGRLDADVAAPDHRRAALLQGTDQTGRLRVVDDHDVAGAHVAGEPREVLGEHRLVDAAGLLVERAAVALGAVQAVVDALGDGEELGRALDDDPARVDPGAARIADERAQQLHDAAALGGRVHVPDHVAVQEPPALVDRALEPLDLLRGEDRAEAVGAPRRDRDHERREAHACALRSAAAR